MFNRPSTDHRPTEFVTWGPYKNCRMEKHPAPIHSLCLDFRSRPMKEKIQLSSNFLSAGMKQRSLPRFSPHSFSSCSPLLIDSQTELVLIFQHFPILCLARPHLSISFKLLIKLKVSTPWQRLSGEISRLNFFCWARSQRVRI